MAPPRLNAAVPFSFFFVFLFLFVSANGRMRKSHVQWCQRCTKDECHKLRETRIPSMICGTGHTRIPSIFCGTSNSTITSSATIDMNLIPKQSVKQNVLLTNINQLQKNNFCQKTKNGIADGSFSFSGSEFSKIISLALSLSLFYLLLFVWDGTQRIICKLHAHVSVQSPFHCADKSHKKLHTPWTPWYEYITKHLAFIALAS